MPVRSTYTKEVVLLLCAGESRAAQPPPPPRPLKKKPLVSDSLRPPSSRRKAVATGTSILLFVMSMSSRHWIFVSTKAAYKWVPYLTFDLGLLGGVATMHAQAGGFENESSVSFEYKDSNQYCPDDQCVALYQAGLVCVVLLSLSVAASFVALIVEVVVMLQLGNVLSETGPFGPYVNYQKCNRNMIWGSISSILGAILSVTALATWAGIVANNQARWAHTRRLTRATPPTSSLPQANAALLSLPFTLRPKTPQNSIPQAHKSDAVTWHPGWSVWASNLLGVLLEAFASFLVCRSVNLSRHPFSGYSSII